MKASLTEMFSQLWFHSPILT